MRTLVEDAFLKLEEPAAVALDGPAGPVTLTRLDPAVVALSTAISLRRIADALEASNEHFRAVRNDAVPPFTVT